MNKKTNKLINIQSFDGREACLRCGASRFFIVFPRRSATIMRVDSEKITQSCGILMLFHPRFE
jgi:hypothetical protein